MTTQSYNINFTGSVDNTFSIQAFNRIGVLNLITPSTNQGLTTNFTNAFEISISSPSPGAGRLQFVTNNNLVPSFAFLDTAYTVFDPFTNTYIAQPDQNYKASSANFIGDGIFNYLVFGGSVTVQPLSDGSVRGEIQFNLNSDPQMEYVATFTGEPRQSGIGGIAPTGGTAQASADTEDTNNPGTKDIVETSSTSTSSTSTSLRGSGKRDNLTGTSSDDTLIGLRGNDRLSGGAGNDIIVGGKGNDRLSGGVGNDQFVFSKAKEGVDRIKDFSVDDDTILVSARKFKGRGKLRTDKAIQKKQFQVGKKANDKNDRFMYDKRSGVLLFDPDGHRRQGSVQIAKLPSGLDFTHQDIVTFSQLSSLIDI